MASQATTPRRSKRFQPIIDFAGPSSSTHETVRWVDEPLYTRTTQPIDLHEEDEIESLDDAQTLLYRAFTRASQEHGLSKKRKSANDAKAEEATFRVGDTVLVKSLAKLPSVAVIVSMWEVRGKDEDDEEVALQKVKVHWFLRGSELPTVRARKEKHTQNEIFFSLSGTATLTPQSILDHCCVSSNRAAINISTITNTSAKSNRASDLSSNSFYCHLAIDARRGLHYELDWEDHRDRARGVEGDYLGDAWIVTPVDDERSRKKQRLPEVKTQRQAKRAAQESESDDDCDGGDDYVEEGQDSASEESDGGEQVDESEPEPSSSSVDGEDEGDEDISTPRTPSRKRKSNLSATTPRRSKRARQATTIAAPTPHSKAALRARRSRANLKRALPAPPPELALGADQLVNLPSDPWLAAMHVLHVGARPEVLPCREEEFGKILRSVEGLLEEGSGGCVYISGVPGTGKTATVHRIVRELKRMAEHNEANPFTYVEINGLKIPEPSAAYCLLWEAVSGHDVAAEGHLKVSAKEALKQLTRHFSAGVRAGPGRHACVVLMDELDQLVTTKQDVVYNFFNWPTLIGSKLIVIAVANTMDLPERVMTGRVRSRLGMVRINFQPYTTPQLEKIVQARLLTASTGHNKENNKSPPPTVIASDGIKFAAMKVSSVSGDARRVLDICRRAVELVQPSQRAARTEDVKTVIKAMQSSPTAMWLRGVSLHERVMLASVLKCVRREGVDEVKWGEVQHQHLLYTNILTGDGDSTRKPSPIELRRVLDSLLASHAVLLEDGGSVSRKPEIERRVMLNIEQSEVERVLGELGGQRWKNALGV